MEAIDTDLYQLVGHYGCREHYARELYDMDRDHWDYQYGDPCTAQEMLEFIIVAIDADSPSCPGFIKFIDTADGVSVYEERS